MNIAREAGAWKISAPHPSSDPRFQMPQKDFSDNRKLEKLWENTLQVSISELGKSPGGGNDNPLQYSRLETSMRT